MRILAFGLLACLLICSSASADALVLSVQRIDATTVNLSWTAGAPLYQVYRSNSPVGLVAPGNVVVQTSATSIGNATPPGTIWYYNVTDGHCATASTCPPATNECETAACFSGDCGFVDTTANTPTSNQTPGDCRINVCDGGGHVVSAGDDSDIPDDGNPCTFGQCNAGTPSEVPYPDGTACHLGAGTRCETGECVPSFVALRVGDGTAALSSASTAAFLEERLPGSGNLAASPIALPTVANGTNQACTLSGVGSSEGGLTRSYNEAYLQLAGYATPVGTATVSSTTSVAVNRVVCRIDAAGAIDTSTLFNTLFSANAVRSAVSDDGTRFWVTGATNGVAFIPRGMTGGTSILASPSNARQVGIYGGQLYGDSGSGTFTNVFTIGAGLPTASGQTATSLPGMPTSLASPFGYVLFDHNPSVAGLDTLYVADSRAIASGGGLQKWTFDGTTWTLTTTFKQGITAGMDGLTGYVQQDGSVALFGSTLESPGRLVKFVDDFVNLNPTATQLAVAGTNTAYRGVALEAH